VNAIRRLNHAYGRNCKAERSAASEHVAWLFLKHAAGSLEYARFGMFQIESIGFIPGIATILFE
jgi:hypothetical protein